MRVWIIVDRFGKPVTNASGKFGYHGIPCFKTENEAKSFILTLADAYYREAELDMDRG